MHTFTTYKAPSKISYGIEETIDVQNVTSFILSGGETDVTNNYSYVPKYITNKSKLKKSACETLFKYFGTTNNFINIIKREISMIKNYIEQYEFNSITKQKHYHTFKIPKRNGRGYREITAPNSDLKHLQRHIKDFIEETLKVLPHDAAHAFRKERDAVTNAQIHQLSKHIINIDLKDFFPSITEELLHNKLSSIYPFSISKIENEELPFDSDRITKQLFKDYLDLIIEIATLNGCLPQGSPLSPLLSNLIMVELDYEITNYIRNNRKELSSTYVLYTRYVDDMTFSSLHGLKLDKVKELVNNILDIKYNNQIKMHPEKTKYLTTTGKCYITGVKLNQDNNLTYGWQKKTQFKTDLFQLFIAEINKTITIDQIYEVLGQFSWLMRIERNYAKYIQHKYLRKFNSECNTLGKHFSKYFQHNY